MKISASKHEIVDALAKAFSIASKSASRPELNNVILEADMTRSGVRVSASDGELTLLTRFEAGVELDGVVALPPSVLGIVRSAPDEVIYLEVVESKLQISSDMSVWNVALPALERVPEYPAYTAGVVIDGFGLAEALAAVVPAAGVQQPRFAYVQTKDGAVRATDSLRLHQVNDVACPDVLLSYRAAAELLKMLRFTGPDKVYYDVDEVSYIFLIGQYGDVLIVNKTTVEYPDILGQMLQPARVAEKVTHGQGFIVNRVEFIDALRRVSLLADRNTSYVTINVLENRIVITATNKVTGDEATETIETATCGPDRKIGFNVKYLVEMLNSVDDKTLKVSYGDDMYPRLSPLYITSLPANPRFEGVLVQQRP